MRTIDPHQTLTPGSTGTYVDKDLSSYLNSNEDCAVFIIETGQVKVNEVARIRAKGATIDPPDVTIIPPGSCVYLTWVDTNKICQIRSDYANTQFHLVGAMSSSSILPTDQGDNYIDKTSSVGTTCTALDLTSDIDGSDDPIGAFWQSGYLSTSNPKLEVSQSTSTCANDVVAMQPIGSSLGPINDSTDVAYLKKTNAPAVWLFGFVSDSSTVSRSAITPIGTTDDAWNDLEDIGASHSGAAYYFEYDSSTDIATNVGLRKKGSTDTPTFPWAQVHDGSTDVRGFILYCEKGTSDTIQYYRTSSPADLPSNIYRLAYLEQPPAGPVSEIVTENIEISDIVIPSGGFIAASVTELINISDVLSITGGSQSITVPEILTLDDIVSPVRMTYQSLIDASNLSDQVLTGFLDIILEDITLDEILIQKINSSPIILENIELSKILSTSFPRYNTVTELLEIDENIVPDTIANIVENIDLVSLALNGATLNISIIDSSKLNDTLFCIYPKGITESINLSLIELTQLSVSNTLTDSQSLSGLLSNKAVFYTEATGFFTLNDSIAQIEAILESLAVDDITTVLSRLYNEILENTQITPIDLNYISHYLLTGDNVVINDSSLSRHFASAFLEDGMNFRIEVEFDNQEYSGWVMNPENYAVSTYSFRFTDSAILGDKYLFSSPNGLYELGGNTDEEETIQSRIKTAAINFGDENVSQVRQAILGTDGDRFILVVSNDDESTSHYELIAPSDGLSSKRIKIGKGLLGTRWQFELIHSREEIFQLSSMEFFPVVFKRKLK